MGTKAANGLVTVYVQIAFGASPDTDPLTWTFTDVTSYVRDPGSESAVTIQRGRGDEASRGTPSTLRVRLDNSDGRFTPANPASPYWPNVKFRTPIQVRIVKGSYSYVRFTGYIHEWPVSWPGGTGRDAVSTLIASGTMRRLAGEAPLGSPLESSMLAHGPDLYWPLTDQPDAVLAEPLAGDMEFGLVSSGRFGGGSGNFSQVDGPAGFGGKGFRLDPDHGLVGFPNNLTLVPRALEVWLQQGSAAFDPSARLVCADASLIIAANAARGGFSCYYNGYEMVIGPGVPSYEGWWHFVCVVEGTDTTLALRVYVNGEQYDLDIIGTTYAEPSQLQSVVASGGQTGRTDGPGIAHLAVWTTIPTAQQVSDRFQAGIGGVGETTAQRIARIARQEGLDYYAVSANERMGPQPSGVNTLGLLEDAAMAEGTQLYESTYSALVLYGRDSKYNTSVTLELNVGSGEVAALLPTWDDLSMANEVTATRPGGVPQTYTDTASVAAYGRYHRAITPNTETDAAALRRAEWEATVAGAPEVMRLPHLTLDLVANPHLIDDILDGYGINNLFRLAALPSQAAQPLRVDLFAEGYTERIGKFGWTLSFNCSPGDPFGRVFVMDGGGELSRLALDGQKVQSSATASDTSIGVTTTAGKPVLTTTAGDLPMWMRNTATGEIFKVTAITGATSPQTLTIARAEQGTTAKAMAANDVLELAPTPVLGL